MEKFGGFKIDELIKKKVKDKHGKLCPQEVLKALREAGVKSFSTKPHSLDWDVVRDDAVCLLERLGKMSENK